MARSEDPSRKEIRDVCRATLTMVAAEDGKAVPVRLHRSVAGLWADRGSDGLERDSDCVLSRRQRPGGVASVACPLG
jgi:hypothetical protein